MDKPIMIFQKRADKEKNRIIIPKAIIDQWGRDLYMQIYQDKIILVPALLKGRWSHNDLSKDPAQAKTIAMLKAELKKEMVKREDPLLKILAKRKAAKQAQAKK